MNEKRNAKTSKIQVGDKVYMENKTRKGLEPRFSSKLFRVIEKVGGTVKIRDEEGNTYKRCTSQVKQAPVGVGEEVQENDDEKNEEEDQEENLQADNQEANKTSKKGAGKINLEKNQ